MMLSSDLNEGVEIGGDMQMMSLEEAKKRGKRKMR